MAADHPAADDNVAAVDCSAAADNTARLAKDGPAVANNIDCSDSADDTAAADGRLLPSTQLRIAQPLPGIQLPRDDPAAASKTADADRPAASTIQLHSEIQPL